MQPGCTVLSLWGSLLPAQCMLDIWQWRELWWMSESAHEASCPKRVSCLTGQGYKWLLPSQRLPSTSFCVNKEKENIIFTAVGANPKISQWQGLLSWAVCSKVKHEIGVYGGMCWLGKGRFNQSSETPHSMCMEYQLDQFSPSIRTEICRVVEVPSLGHLIFIVLAVYLYWGIDSGEALLSVGKILIEINNNCFLKPMALTFLTWNPCRRSYLPLSVGSSQLNFAVGLGSIWAEQQLPVWTWQLPNSIFKI